MTEPKKDLIDRKVRETHRYFYSDGLVEIGVGFLFLLTGLVLAAWLLFEGNTVLRIASVLALPLLATLGALLVKRSVSALKERVTYPRTGYASYRQGEPSVGRWLIMAAALLLAIASFFLPEVLAKMPLMVGALLGILLGYMGYRTYVRRFYIAGSAALLTGLAAAVFVADELLGTALSFIVLGFTLLLSGGLTLLTYLQRHPTAGEKEIHG